VIEIKLILVCYIFINFLYKKVSIKYSYIPDNYDKIN